MKLTLPTMLTLLRIASIPVLVLVFYLPYQWTHLAAALVFALGALTDWLDGWIARRFSMSSAFGAFLDPVADKLAVAVALILIVQRHPTVFMALIAAVIIGREITISALREWMAEIGQKTRVKVVWIGKIKTIAQMVALVMLLYREDIGRLPTFLLGEALLAVAAVLTLWSGFAYLRAAWPAMRADNERSRD
ncbi:MAG: CDP-diacylglycerol--glycerol-3-phosphate 3-phosphatidyltransferase [Lysobacteraceae bacterium]